MFSITPPDAPEVSSIGSPVVPSSATSRSRANTTTSIQSSHTAGESIASGAFAPNNTPTMSVLNDNIFHDSIAPGAVAANNTPAASTAASYVNRLRQLTPLTPDFHDRNFGEQLKRIRDEQPGKFFEGPTGVPENTPLMSEAGTLDTSKTNDLSDSIDLPRVNERLERLPPQGSNLFSSPTASTFDDSHSIEEPLYMSGRAVKGVRTASLSISASNIPKEVTTLKICTSTQDVPTGPLAATLTPESELVREHSDWAHDIESDVQRDLARLANLAVDDHQTDPSRSSEEHYQRRLKLLLNDKTIHFASGDIGASPIPSTAEPGTPPSRHMRLGSGHANYVSVHEFRELQRKFEGLRQMNTQLMRMHTITTQELADVKKDAEERKAAQIQDKATICDQLGLIMKGLRNMPNAAEESKSTATKELLLSKTFVQNLEASTKSEVEQLRTSSENPRNAVSDTVKELVATAKNLQTSTNISMTATGEEIAALDRKIQHLMSGRPVQSSNFDYAAAKGYGGAEEALWSGQTAARQMTGEQKSVMHNDAQKENISKVSGAFQTSGKDFSTKAFKLPVPGPMKAPILTGLRQSPKKDLVKVQRKVVAILPQDLDQDDWERIERDVELERQSFNQEYRNYQDPVQEDSEDKGKGVLS